MSFNNQGLTNYSKQWHGSLHISIAHEVLMRDLGSQHKDYAVFPCNKWIFTELLGRCNSVEGYIPEVDGRNRVPKGFETGFEGLNFLDKEKGYYTYDNALYLQDMPILT